MNRASRILRAASSVRVATVAGIVFKLTLAAVADAPPAHVVIRADPVTGSDARPRFVLEWNAASNAVYRVQSRNTLSQDGTWKTIDLVRPEGSAGAYKIRATTGVSLTSSCYRLVAPQPEICSVEPAVVAAGVPVDLYIIGQCFPSNAVVYVGDVLQTNVTFLGAGLLRVQITFDPPPPGQFAPPQNVKVNAQESGRTLAELPRAVQINTTGASLLEPPVPPPASPARQFQGYAIVETDDAGLTAGGGGGVMPELAALERIGSQASENGSLSTFKVREPRRVLTGGYGWNKTIPNFIRYQLRTKTRPISSSSVAPPSNGGRTIRLT